MENSLSQVLMEMTIQENATTEEKRIIRNNELFEDLKMKRMEKLKEKLEIKINEAVTALQETKKYQNANDEEKEQMTVKKEKEITEKHAKDALKVNDILQILDCDCELFHFISLEDTATDEQKDLYIFDWDNGIYTKDKAFLYRIITVLNPTTTRKMDDEIFYRLMRTASYKHKRKAERSGRYIAFKNGLYDGDTDEFSEHFNPDIVLLSSTASDYNKEAVEPERNGISNTGETIKWRGRYIIDLFANGDEKRETLFYEMVRAVMGAKRNVFLFAWNEKGNGGKSTIGRMLSIIAGEKQTKRLNIDGLGQRFALNDIERFKLILGDDMAIGGKMTAKATAELKTLVTSTEIATEAKGKDVKNSFFNGVIYQCSNDLFTTDDTTGGIVRRCIFLPFEEIPQSKTCAQVTEWIAEKDFIEWIIKETLEHCPNAPERYTEPTNNEQYKQEFKENNDPFIEFVDEHIKPIIEDCERIPLKFIYAHLFDKFVKEYPTLNNVTIQQLNRNIKDKMTLLGYELKKQARINEDQLPITFETAQGENKKYFPVILRENNNKTNFSNVYVRTK